MINFPFLAEEKHSHSVLLLPHCRAGVFGVMWRFACRPKSSPFALLDLSMSPLCPLYIFRSSASSVFFRFLLLIIRSTLPKKGVIQCTINNCSVKWSFYTFGFLVAFVRDNVLVHSDSFNWWPCLGLVFCCHFKQLIKLNISTNLLNLQTFFRQLGASTYVRHWFVHHLETNLCPNVGKRVQNIYCFFFSVQPYILVWFSLQDRRYADLTEDQLPSCESLKDTIARALPFWNEEIAPQIKQGKRVLIAAHGNSLRGIVKHLEGECRCTLQFTLKYILHYLVSICFLWTHVFNKQDWHAKRFL